MAGRSVRAIGVAVVALVATLAMPAEPADAAFVGVGTLTSTDPTQTGRVTRSGVASHCVNPKTFPGMQTTTGAYHYEFLSADEFVPGTCITVKFSLTTPTDANSIFAVAYSSFNAADPSQNWLADPGSSPIPGTTDRSFQFRVPASGAFTIVVHEVAVNGASAANGGTGTGWSLQGWSPQPSDFNGASSTAKAIYRPATGQWFVRGGSPEVTQYGIAGDYAVPGDYDGDGDDDKAIYRTSTGQWIIKDATPVPEVTQYGAPCTTGSGTCKYSGDLPVPADYDGDGDDDIAVFRPTTGQWFIRGATGVPEVTQYGSPCALPCNFEGADDEDPVPADYDGDGDADIAVYRFTTGQWFIRAATGVPEVTQYGSGPADFAVPGDYDGDGDTDIAVYRGGGEGQWFVRGGSPETTQYGSGIDRPAPGDYGGDGLTDKAIYRPATGQWIVRGGSPEVTQYGIGGDVPLPWPFALRRYAFSA